MTKQNCVGYTSVDVVVKVYSHPFTINYSRIAAKKSRKMTSQSTLEIVKFYGFRGTGSAGFLNTIYL